jgi:hypothetical protein
MAWQPFAAISLPGDNPLKDMMPAVMDLPWLMSIGDAGGPPNKRRLLTVAQFFDFTEQQGAHPCTRSRIRPPSR